MNTFDRPAVKEIGGALETVRRGIIAGMGGGLAEIAWVTLYAGATGANPATVARGVTTAVGASALFAANSRSHRADHYVRTFRESRPGLPH